MHIYLKIRVIFFLQLKVVRATIEVVVPSYV